MSGNWDSRRVLDIARVVMVFDDSVDLPDTLGRIAEFFEDESCGQCTPCRVGTEKAVKLMAQGPWDPDLLTELSALMRDASICGLGQAAPNPVRSVLAHKPRILAAPDVPSIRQLVVSSARRMCARWTSMSDCRWWSALGTERRGGSRLKSLRSSTPSRDKMTPC